MKKLIYPFLILASVIFSGCTVVTVDAGEEAVLVKKPFIFGHGGTYPEVIKAGRILAAFSTSKYYYSIQPKTVKERFDDLATKDGTPVDFDLYITTQIESGGAVKIHKEFGANWYTTNVRPKVRSVVRNEVRKYTLQELRMNPNTTTSIQNSVKELLTALITKLDIPVTANNISLGKAIPPAPVLAETAKTAAQKQRIKTILKKQRAGYHIPEGRCDCHHGKHYPDVSDKLAPFCGDILHRHSF